MLHSWPSCFLPMHTNPSSVPDSTQRIFLKHNWPGISWALLILVLSSITPPSFKIPDLFDLFAPDKVAHFGFYAVLVILFLRGFTNMPADTLCFRHAALLSVGTGIVYGGLIELYQGFILSNRVADHVDFLANCIGAFLGWGAVYASRRWLQRL